eukprot:g3229.t1
MAMALPCFVGPQRSLPGHSFEGFALKGKGINSGGIGESFRHPTKDAGHSDGLCKLCTGMALGGACALRAYGKGRGKGSGAFGWQDHQGGRGLSIEAATKAKREREVQMFLQYQRRLVGFSQGGQHQKREDEWNFEEKRSGQSSEFLKTEAVENGRIREDYCLRLFKQAHVSAGIDFDKYDNIEVTTHGGAKDVTAIETHSIPAVLEGNDVLVTAQTGSGKTAAFLIPIITAALKAGPKPAKEGAVCPTSVVLSPTRELCQQITVEAERLTFRSGARVCTPGRLEDFLQRGVLSMKEVKFLALDEADRMLDMGFEPQIREIIENHGMPEAGNGRETMILAWVNELAGDFLDSKYRSISVGAVGATTSSVEQRFEDATSADKFELLLDALKEVEGEQGAAKTIVFANSKDMVDDLRYRLRDSRVRCTSMHGGVSQAQRDRALSDLKGGLANVLVATDVAARGLDLPGIDHVINYDLPQNAEDYVHRVGRTGRIGNKGVATTMKSPVRDGVRDLASAT